MIPVMPRPVWLPAVRSVVVLVSVSLILAWVVGANAGWGLLVLGLVVLMLRHLRYLHGLQSWLAGEGPLPEGRGEWYPVLGALEQRLADLRGRHDSLLVSLERFRSASQAFPDGVIYLDSAGHIEWINQKAEQHFGLNHASDMGRPLLGLVRHPELQHYLESKPRAEPLLIPSPRRPMKRLMIQRVPFSEDRLMLVSRDVTQIEKLENMRRDFIANVSHELRTPLTVVGGFVETVMDGIDDLPREDILRYLDMSLQQSVRMQRLIEDLLALSALETGAPLPHEERVSALDLVRAVYREVEVLSAGRHDLHLTIDKRNEPDLILGNQKELHSAFTNLASNAVRYTPEGKRIELIWRHSAAGAEFVVRDSGLGIDKMHINRLTERFFRVDRGRSRETGGTGLGLAIVKHVVSRHQAELKIASEVGVGSEFSICFPATRLRRDGR